MHQILNDVLKERAMQRLCVIARKELAFVPGVTVIDVKATGGDADRPEAFPPTSFTVNTIGWGPTLHRRCRRFRIGLPHDGTDLTDERFASALRTSAATQAALAAYARRVGVDAPLDPRIGRMADLPATSPSMSEPLMRSMPSTAAPTPIGSWRRRSPR